MTRTVLPNPSARAELLLASITDRALNHWGMFVFLTVELGTTITQTQRHTRPYQTTMTTTISPPSPVNRLCLCSHQVPACPLSALF